MFAERSGRLLWSCHTATPQTVRTPVKWTATKRRVQFRYNALVDEVKWKPTWIISPMTITIATQDTMSAWFWMTNSWLRTGRFLLAAAAFRPLIGAIRRSVTYCLLGGCGRYKALLESWRGSPDATYTKWRLRRFDRTAKVMTRQSAVEWQRGLCPVS